MAEFNDRFQSKRTIYDRVGTYALLVAFYALLVWHFIACVPPVIRNGGFGNVTGRQVTEDAHTERLDSNQQQAK